MERLVSTTEAAEILGLSLQGIHYRIKKNQLRSIKQDGKTFVYINENLIQNNSLQNTQESSNFDKLIEAKDEQITILKKSIKWMRNQYVSEIERLEKNQKRIIEVFNSEIKLLQSAFNEMRAIYKPQIEEKVDNKREFITIKEFFAILKRANKTEVEIKNIIFKAIQNKDERFIYNKNDKKLLILNDNFEDLI
ncbi:DNA-binding protein [Arcobacter lanthieri]|uniref:DNA-binding protein n=1 Tax=Aliarcobacter lanthieri TaxID=1355374 RepID=UPI0019231983|nr:DNA-binding protein [Aliarcobacter lanthieri]MBL3520227.1 DNA-binding protein [Aliarcobacter lanthieri]